MTGTLSFFCSHSWPLCLRQEIWMTKRHLELQPTFSLVPWWVMLLDTLHWSRVIILSLALSTSTKDTRSATFQCHPVCKNVNNKRFSSGGFPGSATCFEAGLAVLDIVPRQQHRRKQVLVRIEPSHPQETSAWFMTRVLYLPSFTRRTLSNLCWVTGCQWIQGQVALNGPPCDPGVACGSETWIITRGVFYTLSHK